MDYEKLNLQNGDILTAEHVTHIEDGITACEMSIEDKTFALALDCEQLRDSLAGTQLDFSTEKQNRQTAEENLLSEAKTYADTQVEQERSQRQISETALQETDIALGARLDTLEAGYRHIASYEHTEDEGVKQIDITQDKDGNVFVCSDFLMFITLPTSADIADNWKTQLYIGHQNYNWDAFIPGGFSRTVTRRMRVHLYHAFDGYWITDIVINDNESYSDLTVCGVASYENATSGSIRGAKTTQNPATEMHFLAQSLFNKGTKIEIYGK